jgi:pyrimidine operon attenuation protein / uracil phosphoribosyltransferase
MKIILTEAEMNVIIKRLCHQILEQQSQPENTVLLGMQPRGVHLMERMKAYINTYISKNYLYGKLDISFYRDDFKNEIHIPNEISLPDTLENKRVILIDDVLYTGRTIRSALDALLDFGRPKQVELCVLISRNFSREFPIQPNYVGKNINTIATEKVRVSWPELHGVQQVAVW